MRNLVEHIINKQYDTANQIFESEIENATKKKLNEAKKMVAARMAEQVPAFMGATGSNAVKLRRGVLEENDIEEQAAGGSSLVVQKSNTSEKGDLGTKLPSRSPEDKRIDDMINKNTKGIIDRKKRGMLPPSHPITVKMEEETEKLDEARIQILKARVRGGKVQRRKKISNVEGFKLQDGKLKRMSPAERRRRKLGQKRGKLKRKAKMRQALMKRKRSLKRRSAIGL